MEYQRLEDIRAHADITEARAPMTRQERLRRWADILKGAGGRRLEALRWVEFYAEAGAPEGALYLDGQLVGCVSGVQRL